MFCLEALSRSEKVRGPCVNVRSLQIHTFVIEATIN